MSDPVITTTASHYPSNPHYGIDIGPSRNILNWEFECNAFQGEFNILAHSGFQRKTLPVQLAHSKIFTYKDVGFATFILPGCNEACFLPFNPITGNLIFHPSHPLHKEPLIVGSNYTLKGVVTGVSHHNNTIAVSSTKGVYFYSIPTGEVIKDLPFREPTHGVALFSPNKSKSTFAAFGQHNSEILLCDITNKGAPYYAVTTDLKANDQFTKIRAIETVPHRSSTQPDLLITLQKRQITAYQLAKGSKVVNEQRYSCEPLWHLNQFANKVNSTIPHNVIDEFTSLHIDPETHLIIASGTKSTIGISPTGKAFFAFTGSPQWNKLNNVIVQPLHNRILMIGSRSFAIKIPNLAHMLGQSTDLPSIDLF